VNLQAKSTILELSWTTISMFRLLYLLQNLMQAIGAQFHSEAVGPAALGAVSMVYLCSLSSRRAVHVIFFRPPSHV
jgi:hypothetical protein